MKDFSAHLSAIKKALWWLGAGVIAALLVWWAAPQYFQDSVDPRSLQRLSQVAAAINRSVPVMIDPETELMPVAGYEGLLVYNYRLVNYEARQVDAAKFAAGAKQKVTQGACNLAEMRDEFLKRGVTLRYAYFDKHKQPIATVDVTPKDCGFNQEG